MAACEGTVTLPFASAQDHEAVDDGDTGPTSGSMGAHSQAPVRDARMAQRLKDKVEFKVLEYNVRFSVTECQVLCDVEVLWEDFKAVVALAVSEGYPGIRKKAVSGGFGRQKILTVSRYFTQEPG